MLSFSLTLGSAPKLSPAASPGPGAQPTRQVSPTVEFGRSGESILSFWTRVLVEHGNTVGTITLDWESSVQVAPLRHHRSQRIPTGLIHPGSGRCRPAAHT